MAADPNLVRAIRGPITLITLGVLFTLDHFTPYSFGQTWPVLLIVFGLLSLMRRGTQPGPGVPPPPGPVVPPGTPPWAGTPGSPPWANPPAPPETGFTSSGGYRQSTYGNIAPPSGTGSSEPGAGGTEGGPK